MTSILTNSGFYFDYSDPEGSNINIFDIASALSKICRFAGHCKSFYSVAQHSVLVSTILPPYLKIPGLLHDATEAYLVDIPSPLKSMLNDYKKIEERVEKVIASRFNLSLPMSPLVKEADLILLATEQRDLLNKHNMDEWEITRGVMRLQNVIYPWSSEEAEAAFLETYFKYIQEDNKC